MLDRDPALQRLVDESDIRALLHRYCRGIDRRQLELVRSCYTTDATDEHGDYSGGVDGFLTYVSESLAGYTSTMHFLGSIGIELDGDRARAESYCIAFHRVPARGSRPERDHVVGLRYVDEMVRADACWLIRARVCALDWTRTDPVAEGWSFPATWTLGRADGDDPVFAPTT